MKAIVEPNLGEKASSMGPRNNEMMKSVRRTAAFHTIGPKEMTAMRIKALGGCCPSGPGKDLTNRYAMVNRTAINIGKMTSEKRTARHPARGTSPESFSDGCPSLFFLYPVIMVRERRQYPIQELLWDLELPRDIHRKNSLLQGND